ncbi:recombinase zinc beta ribbon domain-containing protein [Streptomyces sp. VTCC 41912]|uniref:recombinase zinc beta ribbon domain-containing protein n=1 Tax=Streptomyces sp. VTCC 41912 TaxID=3383243 RepID=UPI003896985B
MPKTAEPASAGARSPRSAGRTTPPRSRSARSPSPTAPSTGSSCGPSLRQLLAGLALGVIDGVILYDLDRLVRQPRKAGIKLGESGATPVVRYFLSGILRCNSCHRGLVGHRHKQRRTGIIIRNYECPPSDRGGCGGTPISAPTADLAVEEVPLPGPPPRPPLPRARSCSASRCKTRSAITRSSRSAWTS